MIKSRCIKIKVHPGQVERAIAFMQSFERRREEAMAALRQNGIVSESVFLDDDGEAVNLLLVQSAEDFDLVTKSFLGSKLGIDVEALQVLAEIGPPGEALPLLVDLRDA